MKKAVQIFILLFTYYSGIAQIPVPMAAQPGLTYTEDFSDIANWTNNFASGIGANRFGSVAAGGAATIPSATKITATTAFFQTPPSSGGGLHRGTDQTIPTTSIVLLSTGTADNTTSAAFDLFLDFTGVDAGTLSFDWAMVPNSTGNRNGSLKVYASTNGTTFTDVTAAFVTNFTNNVAASGNIINVALPVAFNNSPTARLRFYYHNGTGGTTGSRPKLSIDNISVTAVPNLPCVTPTAQPTNLNFSNITSSSIDGSFTAASPAPNSYLVVISNNSSLTSLPVDGNTYNLGDNIGDGYVVSNGNSLSFSTTGLSALTTYYLYVFSVNNVCIGSTKYLTANPLPGNTITAAGLPACSVPATQATNLNFGTATVNTIPASFTAVSADGYLVLQSLSPSLSANPVNGAFYNAGDAIGNATVVQQSSAAAFTATGLSPVTQYYFYIFSYNAQNCLGPVYLTPSPLTGTKTTPDLTPCAIPVSQPANLTFTISSTQIAGTFTAGTGNDAYLVVRSLSPSLSGSPVNNTDYNAGDALGGGIVIDISANKSFINTELSANTTYYFFIFALNKLCSGGTKYLTVNPLQANATTTNDTGNNYYFGNMHAHSDYSDGNQDNPGFTPADDYNYALSSQCMDFLGISEHNHFTANNNPGTRVSNYHLGVTQANNFTTAHPGFLALYGMEWGVINNGGHVLIYGDGMDNLWGWETGTGAWGPTNNYDVFVDKPDYNGTNGLFKTVNDNVATNTFASLAHPNASDFGNLLTIAYSSVADAAITGTAIESGPATSTNTTYSNPASSLNYYWYYQTLLAKGYHLAPLIDHDNHNTTFGRTTYSRTAVIAPSLSKTELIKGFRNMHVYATQDCDTKVDFTLNTNIMGSVFTGTGAPVIAVKINDATTNTAGALIKLIFGVPGSNIAAIKIDSVFGSSMTYVDNDLPNAATGYYYIDITNGSSRIITAPIWYTRIDNAVLPVTISSFTVQKTGKAVKLNWTTETESNSSYFNIERSADGRIWETITSVAAAGNSNNHLVYMAYDNLPLNGTDYYRVKEYDRDGRFDASVVRNVHFDLAYSVTMSPNPATNFVTVTLNNFSGTNSVLQLFNAEGSLVLTQTFNQISDKINIAGLARGLYYIKITNAGQVITQKILLQ